MVIVCNPVLRGLEDVAGARRVGRMVRAAIAAQPELVRVPGGERQAVDVGVDGSADVRVGHAKRQRRPRSGAGDGAAVDAAGPAPADNRVDRPRYMRLASLGSMAMARSSVPCKCCGSGPKRSVGWPVTCRHWPERGMRRQTPSMELSVPATSAYTTDGSVGRTASPTRPILAVGKPVPPDSRYPVGRAEHGPANGRGVERVVAPVRATTTLLIRPVGPSYAPSGSLPQGSVLGGTHPGTSRDSAVRVTGIDGHRVHGGAAQGRATRGDRLGDPVGAAVGRDDRADTEKRCLVAVAGAQEDAVGVCGSSAIEPHARESELMVVGFRSQASISDRHVRPASSDRQTPPLAAAT